MPILRQKQCLFGLGKSVQGAYTFIQVLESKKHVLQGMEAEKRMFQVGQAQKMPIVCPKNAHF